MTEGFERIPDRTRDECGAEVEPLPPVGERSVAFTPGPWMIPAGMKRVVSRGSWHTIALCAPEANPNWTLLKEAVVDANARLIAAAPDLFENERKNLATMEETVRRLDRYGKGHAELDTAIEQTREALAKATANDPSSDPSSGA